MPTRYRDCMLLSVAAAAGCAGGPQKVASLGQDAYRVSVSSPIFASQAVTNHKAFNTAIAFCSNQGEQVLFRQSQESGVHSWSPKHEALTFVCTSASLRSVAVAKD